MTTQQLRDTFTAYFKNRGHLPRPSAPLVLKDDPSSFFTSAGMQPYLKAFRGDEAPPADRVVSIQKCCRTGDIENVGVFNRYHTFFEMLGNFSFGDYFKEGAIDFAWEFVTDVLKLDRASIWVTVFETDDEAEQLWHNRIGVPMDRIVRLGRRDNWWPQVRWEGPCGPCSEIHIDLGPEYGCPNGCDFGCDCDRYMELWNLVFQQYTEAVDGALTPLPAAGIDTGMGLERLSLLMQGVRYNMETDELRKIMDGAIGSIASTAAGAIPAYGSDKQSDIAYRVIADHLRSTAFLLADNVVPSNEGAGYVMRRFIRRAYRYGRGIGAQAPFLYKALPVVAQAMGAAYPELRGKEEFSAKIIEREERRFAETLEQGLALFEEIAEDLTKSEVTLIPGERVFKLSDTYGFPYELTVELARERGFTVDEAGFQAAMAAQRERSRGESVGLQLHAAATAAQTLPPTEFTGYMALSDEGQVTGVLVAGELADALGEGQEGGIVLDSSPFYAERGGQVGDAGLIEFPHGEFAVERAMPLGESILHLGKMTRGQVSLGDAATAHVDVPRRQSIRRNHTATHLLQAALRSTLGEHVSQSGSLVAPDRLRFDFSHHEAPSAEVLRQVEDIVNEWILADQEVISCEMPITEAREAGAIALFGEKYGDTVRTVQVPQVSFELCGGTHCERTGEIGAFRIISESSVAAGTRRIEAVSGTGAIERARHDEALLQSLARSLGCTSEELPTRIEALQKRISDLQAEVKAARQMSAATNLDELLAQTTEINGVKVIATSLPGVDRDMLASVADEVAGKLGSGIIVLGTALEDGKVGLVCKVSDDVVKRGGHAGNIIKQVAAACGGGGGGRPNFAQAGGTDPGKLTDALAGAKDVVAAQVK